MEAGRKAAYLTALNVLGANGKTTFLNALIKPRVRSSPSKTL
jgi:hypothetical protein